MKSLWSRLFGARRATPKAHSRRARLCLESLEGRSLLATLLVTSNADAGAGTLRAAILTANTASDLDTINFAISTGAQTINLASPLPALAFPTVINGTTQPGFAGSPLIELNGNAAGAGANGFVVNGGGSTIRGLVINRFNGSGVVVQSNNNFVRGNYIGTNAAGTAASANNVDGMKITSGGSNNMIGGDAAADVNVISGNKRFGVYIHGSATTGNKLRGNIIGLNRAQTAKVANAVGVWIAGASTTNRLGGAVPGSPNTISGNTSSGIVITGTGTNNNESLGNFIGTTPASATGLGNGGDGITIGAGATNSKVGDKTANAGNIIAGNALHGVNVHGATTSGTKLFGNRIGINAAGANQGNGGNGVRIADGATGAVIGGVEALARNYLASNVQWGVKLIGFGTNSNTIVGNNIGLNAAGNSSRNSLGGVAIQDGASNNTVGGTAAGAGNVISAHITGQAVGVLIAGQTTTGNKVQGNLIGTNAAGSAAIANTTAIRVERIASGVTIGGTVAGARNVIAASSIGINITGAASTVTVQGNLIGTDISGHTDIASGNTGIRIDGASVNTIGGSTATTRNVIAGWTGAGAGILLNAASTNTISGNYLGLDLEGDDVRANTDNIQLTGNSSGNQIGGFTAAAGNVISGATRFGISLGGAGTSGNTIIRNLIGVEADGTTPAGNASHGIFVFNAAGGNQIGGTATGIGNLISRNGGDGVLVGSDASFGGSFGTAAGNGNSILGNRIFNNTGDEIDLGPNNGVNTNDTDDPDTGPNGQQNFPTITFSVLDDGLILIQGTLNSTPNRTFRLEFFATHSPTNPDDGEGEIFIGFTTVTTTAAGDAIFSVMLAAPGVLDTDLINATATDLLTGDTSEFIGAPFIP